MARVHKIWTPADDALLKKRWMVRPAIDSRAIAKELGRTFDAVMQRRGQLGLEVRVQSERAQNLKAGRVNLCEICEATLESIEEQKALGNGCFRTECKIMEPFKSTPDSMSLIGCTALMAEES